MSRLNRFFRFFKISLILLLPILLSACGSSSRRVIRTSSSNVPKWLFYPPKDMHNLYFVGRAEGATSLREGREKAVSDALRQIVQYIGFRVKTRRKDTRLMSEGGTNGGSYEWKLKQTLEGKGDATVSIKMDDFYFEEYSDGKMNVSTLVKISKGWVQKERKRIQNRAKAQRKRARIWLDQAKDELKANRFVPALQNAVQAFLVSEQAVENADLFDESKQFIWNMLTSLSVSLENKPRYAYFEGGSDSILVKLTSSSVDSAPVGVGVLLFPVKGSSKEVLTDSEGRAVLSLLHADQKDGQKEVQVKVGWSLLPFSEIQNVDEEFYNKLKALRDQNSVTVILQMAKRSKVIPTVVVALRQNWDRENKQYGAYKTDLTLRQAVEGLLTENGYVVQSLDIPSIDNGLLSRDELRKAMEKKFKKIYGQDIQLLFVMESVLPLGKLLAEFGSDLESAEVKLSLEWVDLRSGEVQKGDELDTRKPGLTLEQATSIAEKTLIKKIHLKAD